MRHRFHPVDCVDNSSESSAQTKCRSYSCRVTSMMRRRVNRRREKSGSRTWESFCRSALVLKISNYRGSLPERLPLWVVIWPGIRSSADPVVGNLVDSTSLYTESLGPHERTFVGPRRTRLRFRDSYDDCTRIQRYNIVFWNQPLFPRLKSSCRQRSECNPHPGYSQLVN